MTTASQMGSGVIPVLTAGQRLSVAREFAELTQGELAERLGVTPATVQRAESGKTQPRRTTFMAWAMATGVNLYWLETGEAPPTFPPSGGDGDGLPLPFIEDELSARTPNQAISDHHWYSPAQAPETDREGWVRPAA